MSDDIKATTVTESFAAGAVISEVARRHGRMACYRSVCLLAKGGSSWLAKPDS